LIAARVLVDGAAVSAHVVQEIGARAASGEYADGAPVGGRVVAGVLQRLPGALQEDPLLGIRKVGFLRMHAEERGIEQLGVLEDGTRLDEIGRIADLRAEAVLEIGVLEACDGLDAAAQVSPELLEIPGAGKPAGHADDGDGSQRGILIIRIRTVNHCKKPSLT